MLLQVFHILFFYFVGECISHFIHGFIPGSVIGMVLLFLALAFKVVKPCHVNKISKLLTDNMPCHVNKISKLLTDNMGLFFLPAGVGLMTSIGVISHYWAVILISCVISTILVIASVALMQQNFEKRKK